MTTHNHTHNHSPVITNINRAFIIGIILNFLFVVIEVIVGLYIHSLSLLSDAGHNLADVGALALSLLAYRLVKVKSNDRYTYGYKKTSILVALFNAMVLLISIGAIGYEGFHRFLNPEPIQGYIIAWVAAIGIVINTVTALMFMRDRKKDLNIKSAYLHLMSDALVSLGLVIGGIVIHFTNWYWLDPTLALIVAVVILLSTWSLLKHSLRLSMDGVPVELNLQDVKSILLKTSGVQNVHHVHLWAMSTTENAMTAHVVIGKNVTNEMFSKLKEEIKHKLQHKNIQHVTLELEYGNEECDDLKC